MVYEWGQNPSLVLCNKLQQLNFSSPLHNSTSFHEAFFIVVPLLFHTLLIIVSILLHLWYNFLQSHVPSIFTVSSNLCSPRARWARCRISQGNGGAVVVTPLCAVVFLAFPFRT